MKETKIDE